MSSSWKIVRVFISSTFRDMQAERDHLVRFVFPKLREELLKHRIHLVDVDLRWGVTSDQDALGVCREVIDECHPRFMCILGGRYGWVPEGKDKSITADEVHYGVLDRHVAKRGRAFFYFRDDQATAEMVEEAAGEYREPAGSENAGKLAALKESIKKAGLPVVQYGAKWDKEQKRLVGLEKFGECVHDDLLQSLKRDPDLADHFTEDGSAVQDEFAEEAAQMEAFIEERTEHYVTGSRDGVLRRMQKFADAIGLPNILVLTGEPGSGKSALLAKFCRSLPVSASPSLLVSHFVGASVGSTDLRRTLRRLCNELAKAAENTEPLPLDIKELIAHFQKLLAEAAGRLRVILVFDALNQFDATDGAHWMNWLPRELPQDVRIIASVIAPVEGENEHRTLAILRNRKDARVEALKPLDESDTQAIIEGYLNRYSKRLSPEQIAALKQKPASNLPLYILTALEELRTLGTYEEITTRIRDDLPGDVRALFGWILIKRLAHDPGFRDREGRPCGAALVEKLAACVGVSRHGLSPAELTALLDPGDPLGNVAALLRLLRPYLMRRGELLDFYHGQFRDAAGAAYLDTPDKLRAAHQSVATCLQAFADPHRDGQCRDATSHSLSELPHHQTRAEAWPDLIATLENIFFLEAKVTHGMAFNLVMDFTTAVDALPPEHAERQRLRLLDEALRRDIHFIARHANDYPQALFQCLWNSAWWYDCPEAAHYYESTESSWIQPQPWELTEGRLTLAELLIRWRLNREAACPSFLWLRSIRPPNFQLGCGCLAVLRGHEAEIGGIAFSPDGNCLVSGSSDGTVRMWDLQSGAEATTFAKQAGGVLSVAFSPDGSRIVVGLSDNTLRVLDTYTGTVLTVLRGHQRDVSCVAFSHDGRLLISGSFDKTVRIWDAHKGTEQAVLHGHQNMVTSIAISADDRSVVTGSYDQSVRLWDVQQGALLKVFLGHKGPVHSVSFISTDGDVASASSDTTVRLWDSRTGDDLAVLRAENTEVRCVACSPDGRHLVSGSADHTLRVWDVQRNAELLTLRGHESAVTCVAYAPDGCRLASGSSDKSVRIWDGANRTEPSVLRGHERSVNSVSFAPDGNRIATASEDRTVRLWDAQSGIELAVVDGHEDSVHSIVFSPDSHRLAAASNDDLVHVWDARSMDHLSVLRGHEDWVNDMAFTHDGVRLATASSDSTVRVWDAKTGEQLVLIREQTDMIDRIVFSIDGHRIAGWSTASDTYVIWDSVSGVLLEVLPHFGLPADEYFGMEHEGHADLELAGNDDRLLPVDFKVTTPQHIYAAIDNGAETLVEHIASGRTIALFSPCFRRVNAHPALSRWAGVSANYLALFSLEGKA
jgi:WD40 repeat protein